VAAVTETSTLPHGSGSARNGFPKPPVEYVTLEAVTTGVAAPDAVTVTLAVPEAVLKDEGFEGVKLAVNLSDPTASNAGGTLITACPALMLAGNDA
jgi:hypothetical protein